MRYLLCLIGAIQLLVGGSGIWYFFTIPEEQRHWQLILPGLLLVSVGLAGMRVAIKGRGHFWMIVANAFVLVPMLIANWQTLQRGKELFEDKRLVVLLIFYIGLPIAAILLSFMVGRPRTEERER